MEKLLLTFLITAGAVSLCLSQQAFYDVSAGSGNGIRFWNGMEEYKIHFGNGSEYHFGPVTDYSIKMNMSTDPGRGWTWGLPGSIPVAALGNQGNMQIAGTFLSGPITAKGAQSVEETVLNVTNFSDQDFNVRISAAGASTKRTMIGPSSAGRFSLGVGTGNEYLTLLNGGYVGIGTTTPSAKLHLSAASRTQAFRVYMDGNTSNYLSLGQGSGGAVIDPIGTGMLYLGYDQSTNVILGYGGGKVGIGTGSPDYPLTVNGSIHAKEVRVDLNVPAPDYVFEKEYKLTPLEEIKTYIDQNKHLPEVPSAKEIEQNGVQLGEMNMILLKKIEELTLHMIAQQSEIERVNKKNIELEHSIQQLADKNK